MENQTVSDAATISQPTIEDRLAALENGTLNTGMRLSSLEVETEQTRVALLQPIPQNPAIDERLARIEALLVRHFGASF
jgi:hypothetical protein